MGNFDFEQFLTAMLDGARHHYKIPAWDLLKTGPFHLRGREMRAIGPKMNARIPLALALLPLLCACDRPEEMEVTETRSVTTRDVPPKLFASSDERFRDARPSPVRADTPDGWLQLPSTQFRLLNYRFGESGLGEVWVTITGGSVMENVNRWLAQFDALLLDREEFEALRTVPVAGGSGTWVEAEGEYAPGMGSPPRPGYGLAGVVASLRGDIVTVKMVGPRDEVLAEREKLENFAKNLKLTD